MLHLNFQCNNSHVPSRTLRSTPRGRPLKFGRPARSITLTLPDDAIAALRARDRDIGRAIVSLLAGTEETRTATPSVELHQTGQRAVIVTKPVDVLRRLPGVELVSLGDPNRALIAFDAGTLTVSAFELHVQDLLDGPPLPADDADVVERLAVILRDARRSKGRSLSEASIIVLDDVPARRTRRNTTGRTSRARPNA